MQGINRFQCYRGPFYCSGISLFTQDLPQLITLTQTLLSPPPSILENPSAPPCLFQLTSINGLTHQGTYEVQIQMEYLQKREPLPSVLAASALVCTLKDPQSTFLSEQYSNFLKLWKSARIIRNCISPGSNKRDKTVISFELSLTRQGFRLLHFLNNRGSTCVYSHTTHTG